jgi:hypothetical protein
VSTDPRARRIAVVADSLLEHLLLELDEGRRRHVRRTASLAFPARLGAVSVSAARRYRAGFRDVGGPGLRGGLDFRSRASNGFASSGSGWYPRMRTFASHATFVTVEPASVGLSPAELAAALRERGVLIRPMDGRVARVTVGRADQNAALLAALTDLL